VHLLVDDHAQVSFRRGELLGVANTTKRARLPRMDESLSPMSRLPPSQAPDLQ
jgi:hypothetical protein